jgi:hypothetical protein
VLDLCLIYFEFKKSNDSCGGDDSKIRIDELNRRLNRLNLKLKLEDLIVGTHNARSEFIKRVTHKKSDFEEDEEFIEEDNEDNDDVFDNNNNDDDNNFDYDNGDDDDLIIVDEDDDDHDNVNDDDDDDDNECVNGINDIELFDLYSTTNEQKQPSNTLRWRKDQFKYRNQSSNSSSTSITSASKSSIQTTSVNSNEHQLLSTECTLVVLDTIDVLVKYIQQIQQKRQSISSTTSSSSTTTLSIDSIIQANYLLLLTNIFKLILNSFSLNQSVNALKHLFSQHLFSKYETRFL